MGAATARLSGKGQVVIPKAVREQYGWQPGQELHMRETGEGIILTTKTFISTCKLEDVAGFLAHDASRKSIREMDAAIREKRTRVKLNRWMIVRISHAESIWRLLLSICGKLA